jgi:RraA family protein
MTTLAPKPAFIRDFERLPQAVVDRAALLQPAILADVNGRRGALHGRIRSFTPGLRICGNALTVEVRPGDNLMIHAALSIARAGDVLVIDGKGDLTCALMGGIMMSVCRQLGLAGVVIDGAVRDLADLRGLGVPVFAAGANPNGPTKCVPGLVNHLITAGGVAVSPGDLVVADDDGVVVIERAQADRLLPLGEKKVQDEAGRLTAIRQGKTAASWLQGSLQAAGIE